MKERSYELNINIIENGSWIEEITAKDNFYTKIFSPKGMIEITYTKWEEKNNVDNPK